MLIEFTSSQIHSDEFLLNTYSGGSGIDSTQDILPHVSLSAFVSPSAASPNGTAFSVSSSSETQPTSPGQLTSLISRTGTISASSPFSVSTPSPSSYFPSSIIISDTNLQTSSFHPLTTNPSSILTSLSFQTSSPSQTNLSPAVIKDQVELVFVFIALVVFLGLLIGLAVIVLVMLCFCQPQSKRATVARRNGVGRGIKIEELPMVNPNYRSVSKPLPPPIPERTEESQTFLLENALDNLDTECRPEELLAFDSLRPLPPPPAQVTPRSSMRVSNVHLVSDGDYFCLEDATTGRYSDYKEPQDNIGIAGPIPNQAAETSIDPYEDDIDGELDATNHRPPPPVPPRGASQVSSSSELSDSHDYDHIYREPLEPSMLSTPHSPSKRGQDALPYAPIYTIPKGKSSITFQISVNNIRLIQELGKGHFGKVYLAATTGVSLRDLKLSDDCNRHRSLLVAVKQLKAHPSRDLTEAFHKQISFISRLKHANVIRLLATSTGESPFIVMEYMENGDLHEFLRKQQLRPETVSALDSNEVTPMILFYIAVQISSGMHYLASKKFVHRDLAARNCLIGRDFVVKISDFGMSRNVYKTSYFPLTRQLILPIRWMATETFYGKFSVKSDAWAFGVTVWEVFSLCQTVPYNDMTDSDVIQDALNGEERKLLSKPDSCPVEVYEIMKRCFVFQPFMRADFEEIYSRLIMIYTELSQQNT